MVENSLSHNLLVNLSFTCAKPTGITTYAANLFPYLQSLNPTLLVSHYYPKYKYYLVPDNLTSEQGRGGHIRRLFWTQLKLPNIYHQLRSSLLFSPIPEAPIYNRCRSVVMVHDLIPLRFPRPYSPLTFYFRYYIPQVLRQAEHIICNSNATARDIADFFNIRANKITPIPLAYDTQHFRPLDLSSSTINQQSHYFLYLGRQDIYKNLDRLLSAFAAIPNFHDYQLWLAGPLDQRYTPKLKAQAQELGLTNYLKFLDYVPYEQLPKIINQALALVFPTLWEGFGLPVLEAMACGTPVITSDLSSLPEVVGNAALLINPYKTEEITYAMKTIATDSQLRSHLRNLSLERAKQFSWEATGQATVEVLKQYL